MLIIMVMMMLLMLLTSSPEASAFSPEVSPDPEPSEEHRYDVSKLISMNQHNQMWWVMNQIKMVIRNNRINQDLLMIKCMLHNQLAQHNHRQHQCSGQLFLAPTVRPNRWTVGSWSPNIRPENGQLGPISTISTIINTNTISTIMWAPPLAEPSADPSPSPESSWAKERLTTLKYNLYETSCFIRYNYPCCQHRSDDHHTRRFKMKTRAKKRRHMLMKRSDWVMWGWWDESPGVTIV